MNILLLGKVPPIQGGVSAQTYHTVVELALRGHSVDVVTNAEEVEANHRVYLFDHDRERLTLDAPPGRLNIHATEPLLHRSYIPWAAPYATALFGLALSVARERQPDVVVGWYFEPYGIVAAQVAATLRLPLVLIHAGSDLGRLARNPHLGEAYRWAIGTAQAVLTGMRSDSTREQLARLGVSDDKVYELPIGRLPKYFTPSVQPLDLVTVLTHRSEWPNTEFHAGALPEQANDLALQLLTHDVTAVGIFGKISAVKGTFVLLSALGELARSGRDFIFLVACGGRPRTLSELATRLEEEPTLKARTLLLPLVAPWRVPELLRLIDVGCFLERDFPIPFHSPRVPREILASGTCLVSTREILSKQPFYESLVDSKNVVEIQDPRDGTLAARLDFLIADREAMRVIAKHGLYLSQTCEKFFSQTDPVADAFERLGRDKLSGILTQVESRI
jgi:glycosyltransferase involved in cell wall biosynthesis